MTSCHEGQPLTKQCWAGGLLLLAGCGSHLAGDLGELGAQACRPEVEEIALSMMCCVVLVCTYFVHTAS